MAEAAKRITAWGPSRLNDYDSCPAKAKYKHVLRLKEPGSEAMDRGNEMHKSVEAYIRDHRQDLHPELKGKKKFKKYLNELRAEYKLGRVKVELELAFDRSWKPCEWFAKDTYVRIKVDCLRLSKDGKTVEVIDWKSGKYHTAAEKPEYMGQLDLYAVAALVAFPQVEKALPSLYFMDHEEVMAEDEDGNTVLLERKKLVLRQKYWDKRAKPMLTDSLFPPRPGKACRWCHFSANKAGPCEF